MAKKKHREMDLEVGERERDLANEPLPRKLQRVMEAKRRSEGGAGRQAGGAERSKSTKQSSSSSVTKRANRDGVASHAKRTAKRFQGLQPGESWQQFNRRLAEEQRRALLEHARTTRRVSEKHKQYLQRRTQRQKEQRHLRKLRQRGFDNDADRRGEDFLPEAQLYVPPHVLARKAARGDGDGGPGRGAPADGGMADGGRTGRQPQVERRAPRQGDDERGGDDEPAFGEQAERPPSLPRLPDRLVRRITEARAPSRGVRKAEQQP